MAYEIKNNVVVAKQLTAERTTPSIANALPNWVTATNYIVGDVIVDTLKLYKCTVAHTSSALFITDIANWAEISAGSAFSGWALTGNTILATDFIGSNNAQPFTIKTNAVTQITVAATGEISLAGVNPVATPKLSVTSSNASTTPILVLTNTEGSSYHTVSIFTPENLVSGSPGDMVYTNISGSGEAYIKQSGSATTAGWARLDTFPRPLVDVTGTGSYAITDADGGKTIITSDTVSLTGTFTTPGFYCTIRTTGTGLFALGLNAQQQDGTWFIGGPTTLRGYSVGELYYDGNNMIISGQLTT